MRCLTDGGGNGRPSAGLGLPVPGLPHPWSTLCSTCCPWGSLQDWTYFPLHWVPCPPYPPLVTKCTFIFRIRVQEPWTSCEGRRVGLYVPWHLWLHGCVPEVGAIFRVAAMNGAHFWARAIWPRDGTTFNSARTVTLGMAICLLCIWLGIIIHETLEYSWTYVMPSLKSNTENK